jgi:hypothetical protein
MTTIEIMPDSLFLTTTDREELLELIAFITKNYDRMKTREQRQITLFEYREIQPPPIIDELPEGLSP